MLPMTIFPNIDDHLQFLSSYSTEERCTRATIQGFLITLFRTIEVSKTYCLEFGPTDTATSNVFHSEELLQDFVISFLVHVAAVALLQKASEPTLQIRYFMVTDCKS